MGKHPLDSPNDHQCWLKCVHFINGLTCLPDKHLALQFDRDPDGFGVNTIPDPPLRRTSSSASESSTISLAGASTAASSHLMSDSDSCASSYSRVPRR